MDAFVGAVWRALDRFEMVAAGQRVLVAVSGGPDSVALLSALSELAKSRGMKLVAAHLNHALRGAESDRDEHLARQTAARFGMHFVTERLAPGALEGKRGGIEQAARQARYAFLHRVAREQGCRRIATGHTRDDQAETVLLRLLRGSRKPGLGGVHPVRRDGVIRPLIGVTREEVLGYLERRGLDYAVDRSNADRRHTRNLVRLDLMPRLREINPRVAEHLADLAESWRTESAAEEALARELVRPRMLADGGLPLEPFEHLPEAARRLLVREWLRAASGHLRRVEAGHIEAIAACTTSGREVALPGGGRVVNEHGVLRFGPPAAAEGPATLAVGSGEAVAFGRRWRIEASDVEPVSGRGRLPASEWEAVFDADMLPLPVNVRAWIRGDRIQPLGIAGHRKLSDVFVDKKVPRRLRRSYPVIEGAEGILWVPGLVRSSLALVTPITRRTIRLVARSVPPQPPSPKP